MLGHRRKILDIGELIVVVPRKGVTTTNYALDVAIGLAEVIFTSPSPEPAEGGHAYLHLPGVMMTESADNETRYLLSDGLGSVRHVTDETGELVTYQEFDPYGSPLTEPGDPYGYTGEWWQADIGLLHLRARWYEPQSGTFLSVDPVESEPPYQYVRGNVVNRTDPSGYAPECDSYECKLIIASSPVVKATDFVGDTLGNLQTGHLLLIHENETGHRLGIEAQSSITPDPYWDTRIVENYDVGDTGILFGFLDWDPIFHPYDTIAGHLWSSLIFDQARLSDHQFDNPDAMSVTVTRSGNEMCLKRQCLLNAMKQVETNRIGYFMLGPNSNSAAFSALRACGLQAEGNLAISRFREQGRYHPGYNLNLLSFLANGRPARYQLYKNGGNLFDLCVLYPELCPTDPI